MIINGIRNRTDGLWDIPLTTTELQQNVNFIIQRNKTKYQLANFYHGALCSPSLPTLIRAINNDHFLTWPGIKKLNFRLNIVDTQAMDFGHLDQHRQNLQSTKSSNMKHNQDTNPEGTHSHKKTYETLNMVMPFTAKELTYGDLTGAFPYTSTRGSKYIFVMYDVDSNAILVQPLKSKGAHEIKKAWRHLTDRLTLYGHKLKHYILDNECSQDLRKAI